MDKQDYQFAAESVGKLMKTIPGHLKDDLVQEAAISLWLNYDEDTPPQRRFRRPQDIRGLAQEV